jgi:hypothetical protein
MEPPSEAPISTGGAAQVRSMSRDRLPDRRVVVRFEFTRQARRVRCVPAGSP